MKINTFLKNFIFIFIFLFITIINTKTVKAGVYDEVNILGTDKTYIETRLDSFEKANDCNILFRLYNDYGNIDKQIDFWYSQIAPELKYDKSIIFAVNFSSRETLIIGYDNYSWVNFYDNSDIIIKTSPYLTNEDYKGCIDEFFKLLPKHISTQKGIKTAFIIIINLIIFNLLFFFISKTYGNKDTTTTSTYLTENSRIVGSRDIFIRKTITKTKKSSSSSGGHSHGSGGHGHF